MYWDFEDIGPPDDLDPTCYSNRKNVTLLLQPPNVVPLATATATPSSDVKSNPEKEPVRFSSDLVVENEYPLLKGRPADECEYVITRNQLESTLVQLRPLISKMMPTIAKMKEILALPRTICALCGTEEMNASNALEHCTTKLHISKVYSSGLVFSRTLDLEMFLGRIREAVGYPFLPPEHPSVTRIPVTRNKFDIHLSKPTVTKMTDFPFFQCSEIHECSDIVPLEELLEKVSFWYCLDKEMQRTICEIVYRMSPSAVACELCVTKPMTGNAFLEHCISKRHIKKAYHADLVCSRSKDLEVFFHIFSEAQRLMDEYPIGKRERHTNLRDPSVRDLFFGEFPLLSPRPPPREVFLLLADWQVCLVWENARRFCSNDNCLYADCLKFAENCPQICLFCYVRKDCVCGMLEHVFSEEHRLKMGHPVRYEDVLQWTNVLDEMWKKSPFDWVYLQHPPIWDGVFAYFPYAHDHGPIYQWPKVVEPSVCAIS